MIRAALRAALPLLAIALATSACPYQTTDTPICGDQLLPSGDACALWPVSCGCASGQRCGFNGSTTVCVAPGTQGIDAPCSMDSQCATGTLCDGTRCRQACFESLDCGSDDAVACLYVDDAQNNRVAAICHRDCDPVTPHAPIDPLLETCLSNETCHVYSDGEPACDAKAGTGVAGAACKSDEDCKPGFGCVGTSGANDLCARYCWVESPSTCTGSQKCDALTYSQGTFSGQNLVLLGKHTVGVCQ